MVNLLRIISVALIANGLCWASAAAQTTANQPALISPTDTWILLSTQQLAPSAKKITVSIDKKPGAFKALRLRAPNQAVSILNVDIGYANGSVHREDRNIALLSGERSRPLDLQAVGRPVEKVTLTIAPDANLKRARTLQVWGLQSDPSRRAAPAVANTPDASDTKRDTPRAPPATTAALPQSSKPAASETAGQKQPRTPAAEAVTAAPPPPKPISVAAAARLPGKVAESPNILIGAQYINFDVDRDIISIGSEVGKFKRIRLRVQHRDVSVSQIEVRYANARSHLFEVGKKIPANANSDWIDVDTTEFIQAVRLEYRKRPKLRDQARIEVFGEYADGWLSATGEGHKHNEGWVLLAAQSAGFVGFDEDTVSVGENTGGFNKLRVTVRDRAISLKNLKVVYADGSADLIPIRTRVDAGSTYGPVTIKNDGKAVVKIQAAYRSRFIDRAAKGKGSAVVEFWAKR